jgi:hypothetical protein
MDSPPVWRTSSYTGNYDCVEVAAVDKQVVAVRDSKDASGPRLAFSAAEWRTLTRCIKDGRLDL